MPIVGTAGHVDHGKSTLVLALTGRDPDRWEEEKRRGLTIDLGFAWTELEGEEIAFVDVPGHERFIKNMLAGIEAIDVALLVVAADEGWMPQSEEHLAVLDLLGVDHGVVALTKVDRVDPDLIELTAAEVEERLAGTSLEGSPVVPVSAPTGRGVDRLRSALAGAVVAAGPPHDRGRPRLWVDRSFTISGAGTVVTGTLLGGSLSLGQRVTIWPGGSEARIRGLESHERPRPTVAPGNRVAVNLAGVERSTLARGSMVGAPGQWRPSQRLLVEIATARYVDRPLTERGAYHLHLGSGAWPVGLRPIGDRRLGPDGIAVLTLSHPLPVTAGDRFILREVGRRAVVAGGRVLAPDPPSSGAEAARAAALLRPARTPDEVATVLLETREMAPLHDLEAHSDGGRPVGALVAGEMVLSRAASGRLAGQALELAESYHRANPLRPGIPKASLASLLRVEMQVLETLVEASPELRDEGSAVAAGDFQPALGAEAESAWGDAEKRLRQEGLGVPRADRLGLDPELLHAMIRSGRLVRVSESLVYLPSQIEEVQSMIERLPEPFTVGQFRDALGITRRHAVPLLEWLDASGLTVREGDLRRVRKPGSTGRRSADGARPR